MVLLIFDVSIFRCSQNINSLSSIIPRCFWDKDYETWRLLKNNSGWRIFFDFRLKMTSWACLLGSPLKFIFCWKSQLLILAKPLFSFFADVFMSSVTENKECHLQIVYQQKIDWLLDHSCPAGNLSIQNNRLLSIF